MSDGGVSDDPVLCYRWDLSPTHAVTGYSIPENKLVKKLNLCVSFPFDERNAS